MFTYGKKTISFLIYMLGISPFFYIAPILTFYFHARNILGRFPSYDNPDPKKLSIYTTYNNIISPAFEIWVICLLIWIILCILLIIITRQKVYTTPIKMTCIGHVIAVLIALSPIFEWYID